jgi:hypothetical protein
MSNTGKQSPLGVNVMAGLLQGKGFWINQPSAGYMGASTSISNYTYGSIVYSTVLNNLTNAIREGWVRYNAGDLSLTTYTNLISVGSTLIPALGNSPPATYTYTGSPSWAGAGYAGETASYGYVRLFAWQAYNEFNYNNTLALTGFYNDFVGSFMSASTFIDYSNQSIMTMHNSLTFLDGTYSNMNDLITADITGVSLATTVFGQDLINLGRAIDLSTLWTFGFPSHLLATIKKYNALTDSLTLALLASGLTNSEIEQVITDTGVTTAQQQKIYAAFLIITGVDLESILVSLNCKTTGFDNLGDLLNVRKLFPNSYDTLTVPIYNAVRGLPTNSKTYYPIFHELPPVPPVISPGPPPPIERGGGYEFGGGWSDPNDTDTGLSDGGLAGDANGGGLGGNGDGGATA